MRQVKPDGPHIYSDRLYQDYGESIALGTAAWQAWLHEAGNRAFVFRDSTGAWHHARRETRRGQSYWYVACRVAGRVRRFYLGPAAALDVERLVAVAAAIAAARAGKEERPADRTDAT